MFYNIIQPCDNTGCGIYRMHMPTWAATFNDPSKVFCTTSMRPVIDPNFYQGVRTVRVQKKVSAFDTDFLLKMLKPLSDNCGFWLGYEIDDVLDGNDIPQYNRAKHAYMDPVFRSNISNMLNAVDFVTTTTDELKQYCVDKYGTDSDKILVIPNYIPKWWIANYYESHRKRVLSLSDKRNKPRILIPASNSHYDMEGKNNNIDDMSHITDFIRNTVNKYEWFFIGSWPRQLDDLVRTKKITIVPPAEMMNYPRLLDSIDPHVILAPLMDNIFNKCKSNIKLLEGWSMGIPVIAQNICTYNKYTEWTFNDAGDLQNKLDKLFRDNKQYEKIIKTNRSLMEKGSVNFKYFENGAWMENNLDKWNSVYKMPQKTLISRVYPKQQELKNATK